MFYTHIAVSVNNIDESQAFYEAVLDMKFISRQEIKGIVIVHLEDEKHNGIELFKHENPLKLEDNLMNFQKVGIKHIAFFVENLDEKVNKALLNGSSVIRPDKDNKRMIFISDPNGIPIELIELNK